MPRRRLAARIVNALEIGSLVVAAPAGYGKTTALAEAVGLSGGTVAWLSCSPSDRDAGRLLVRLVGSIRRAVPGAAEVVAERLDVATERIDPAIAVHALEDELERLLVDPLIVVVDEVEHLAGAAEAEAVIAGLVAMPLKRLRVAVAARWRPRLPTARLRLAGRLTELGAADLAFGVEECAELMLRRTGRAPPEEEVEAVWMATEGWPLGVALAASSDRPPVGPPSRAGGLDAYLTEELLNPLEPRLRDAIIDSSVVAELNPSLVRALELPEDLLEQVHRRGIPLSAAAVEEGRFAYHPLVRDLLAARLVRERSAARRAQLHAVVADALEAGGREAEAIEHWLAAGGSDRASELVARHGPALLAAAPVTVAGWLARLPEDERAAPALRLLEGRLARGDGRLEQAEALLSDAAERFASSGDDDQAWAARAALADTCALRLRFDATIRLKHGYASSPAAAAPVVALSAGAALAGTGQYGAASALFAEVAERSADGPLAPLAQAFHAFFVDFPCGRLDAALAGVLMTVAQLERADPFDRLAHVLGMTASIHDERGETAEALACFTHSERVADSTEFSGYVNYWGHVFRAGVYAREGRLLDAELALSRITGSLPGWYTNDTEVTRATIAVGRGGYDGVERAIDAAADVPWEPRIRATALLVPVLVAADRRDRALQLVDGAFADRPALASGVRLLALRAWLRRLDGDQAGALADVTLAWEEAGDGAHHLVRRERPRMTPLLWDALEQGALAPESVVGALDVALPSGAAVLAFTRHPVPEVRRAAIVAAVASGHPGADACASGLESDPDRAVASAARVGRARLRAEPPPLVFTVLGGFAVRRGTHVIDDEAWRRKAAQRLVRILLMHREVEISEDALFAALWPDKTAAAARRNLQVIVSAARAVLDWPGTDHSVLLASGRTYRLELSDRDAVDADEFQRAAAAALGARVRDRPALLEAAASRWTGEPLPDDHYEDWAVPARERLTDLYGRLLTALAEVRSSAGDDRGAVDAHRRHIELDPLDEAAQRGLMRAYARTGRRGHALRQYLACRRALLDGLGIEPAKETSTLQRLILAGETV